MNTIYKLIFTASAFILLFTFPKTANADSNVTDSQNSLDNYTYINYNNESKINSSSFYNSSKYVVNPGGMNYKLKQTIVGNNLSTASFFAQLAGDYHHAGFSELGDYFLKQADKNKWYVSKWYLDEDSKYVYGKTVTNIYSNSGMTKLVSSYTRTYKLPK